MSEAAVWQCTISPPAPLFLARAPARAPARNGIEHEQEHDQDGEILVPGPALIRSFYLLVAPPPETIDTRQLRTEARYGVRWLDPRAKSAPGHDQDGTIGR